MRLKIVIYCSDHHLTYNIFTLNRHGVGGGISARVRMAHALAARGQDVTLYINCPSEKTIKGVTYRHWTHFDAPKTDIFIAGTSGGEQDLTSLRGVNLQTKFNILMIHGTAPPKGLEHLHFDYIYTPSDYVRKIILFEWEMEKNKSFVTHHGVVEEFFAPYWGRTPRRDPYALVYASHPSKGLDTAIRILQLLREKDPRFSLHVYGGHQLWGEEEKWPGASKPGLVVHGLVGQRELARRLQACGFSLNLQARQEPFGMVVTMRAGCIVLASPVGAYPEIIRHGYNGFLIPGDHEEEQTQEFAARTILSLTQSPDYLDYIRRNAVVSPLSWDTVAQTWEGHWDWALGDKDINPIWGTCPECRGNWLPLADGLHCTGCGRFSKVA